MSDSVRIAITRDLFDEEGNLVIPGEGMALIDRIPRVEHEVLAEILPEIAPEQVATATLSSPPRSRGRPAPSPIASAWSPCSSWESATITSTSPP